MASITLVDKVPACLAIRTDTFRRDASGSKEREPTRVDVPTRRVSSKASVDDEEEDEDTARADDESGGSTIDVEAAGVADEEGITTSILLGSGNSRSRAFLTRTCRVLEALIDDELLILLLFTSES